jgi:secondary thiamine-phosphate synthase enzyme
MFKELIINTRQRICFQEITSEIRKIAAGWNLVQGVIVIFNPHTTAGITINEHADPSVACDIEQELNRIIPLDRKFTHLEGNSDAHIKSSIIGSSQMIIIENSQLKLGTWQGIFFCEFDGPRQRKVWIKGISG